MFVVVDGRGNDGREHVQRGERRAQRADAVLRRLVHESQEEDVHVLHHVCCVHLVVVGVVEVAAFDRADEAVEGRAVDVERAEQAPALQQVLKEQQRQRHNKTVDECDSRG